MVAVLQPAKNGKLIPIDRAVVLVGRGSDCDAIIQDSQKISRRHCCLVQVDETYYIRDLGSMNGVWVNGERVERESQMRTGDKVSIGDVEFLFHSRVRIEQKKTISDPPEAVPVDVEPPPMAESAPVIKPTSDSEEADLIASGAIKLVDKEKDAKDAPAVEDDDGVLVLEDSTEGPQLTADGRQIVDDIILLDVNTETNELETMDEPIVDDFIVDDDDDDELLILE